MLVGQNLIVANVGDSRAVLSKGGQGQLSSTDHPEPCISSIAFVKYHVTLSIFTAMLSSTADVVQNRLGIACPVFCMRLLVFSLLIQHTCCPPCVLSAVHGVHWKSMLCLQFLASVTTAYKHRTFTEDRCEAADIGIKAPLTAVINHPAVQLSSL